MHINTSAGQCHFIGLYYVHVNFVIEANEMALEIYKFPPRSLMRARPSRLSLPSPSLSLPLPCYTCNRGPGHAAGDL